MDKKSSKTFLTCPFCSKQYEKKFYFEKHVASHKTSEDPVDAGISNPTSTSTSHNEDNQNQGNNDDMWEEDVPFIESAQVAQACKEAEVYFDVEDEEEEVRRSGGTSINEPPQKKAKTSRKGRKALVKCPACKTSYFTVDGYLKHRRVHAFASVLDHCPSLQDVKDVSSKLMEETLSDMASELDCEREPGLSMMAAIIDLQSKCDSTEWSAFVCVVTEKLCVCLDRKKSFALPVDLKAAFLECTAQCMGSSSDRALALEQLERLIVVPLKVFHLLIASVIRRYSTKILVYVLQCLNNKGQSFAASLSETYAVTEQSTEDVDFKQNMHYIGGANIKSVLRKAFTIKNPDHEWLCVINVVKKKFLVNDASEMPHQDLVAWTQAKDRGGLIKINEQALDFFVSLGCIVKSLEHFDGSLLLDEVFEKVVSSDLMLLWDRLVQNELSSRQSFKLLYGLCYHFTNTWRSGVVSRRLDNVSYETSQKHGTQGVAFRAKLAA